jgi:predicted DNA-binding transcriptional regulator AlpA
MNLTPTPTNEPAAERQPRYTGAMVPLLVETRRAAEIIGFSVSTLEKWRFYETPGSPPVVRIGRACRYRLSDLHDWVDRQGDVPVSSLPYGRDA